MGWDGSGTNLGAYMLDIAYEKGGRLASTYNVDERSIRADLIVLHES